MTFELSVLTANVARAIILDIADEAKGYNKEWSWWAYDAMNNTPYTVGTLNITLIENERVTEDDSYAESEELLLVWKVEGPWESEKFFTMKGVTQSYGGDDWNGRFREAKAKIKSVVVYE